jgi:hypothetical protein
MSLMGLNSLHSLNSLIASYVDNLALSSWNTAWEEAPRRGGSPPHGPPPIPDLVSFTSKITSVFTDITSTFADVLGLDCM